MKGAPAVPRGPLTSMPTWSNTSECFTTSAFFSLSVAREQSTKEGADGKVQIDQITRDRPHGRRWRGRRWRGTVATAWDEFKGHVQFDHGGANRPSGHCFRAAANGPPAPIGDGGSEREHAGDH